MYSQLWICPLQIACLYKIFNSVDVASATENLFCTAVSVVSDLISHYPGLLIGGSTLPCLVQSPILLPIYQRLYHVFAYLYMLHILFFLLTLTLRINLSTIKYWASTIDTFSVALSNWWIIESSLHCIVGGAHGTLLSTIFIHRWKFELVLYSSPIDEISNKIVDVSESNSSDRIIFWHSWISSSVGGCVMIPQLILQFSLGWTGLLMTQFPESQNFGIGLGLSVIFHPISKPQALSKLQYYHLP